MDKRRDFNYVLYKYYTEEIEYTAGHILHISRVHARQVQKTFCFSYSVCMNTFFRTVCCILPTCVVKQAILWDSWHGHSINNTIYEIMSPILYHTQVFRGGSGYRPTSVRCEVHWWQQQLKCEWNAKPQNCEADAQEYWASWLLTMFLHSLAYFFQLIYYEPNFKYQIFYFQDYSNMAKENKIYQQLQKL